MDILAGKRVGSGWGDSEWEVWDPASDVGDCLLSGEIVLQSVYMCLSLDSSNSRQPKAARSRLTRANRQVCRSTKTEAHRRRLVPKTARPTFSELAGAEAESRMA